MGPSPSGTIYVTGDTDNVLYRFQEQREPTTLGDVNLDYRTDVTDVKRCTLALRALGGSMI